jgi:hypothetical protein
MYSRISPTRICTANRYATITGYTTTEEHIKSWKKDAYAQLPSFPETIAGTKDVTIAEVDATIVST